MAADEQENPAVVVLVGALADIEEREANTRREIEKANMRLEGAQTDLKRAQAKLMAVEMQRNAVKDAIEALSE